MLSMLHGATPSYENLGGMFPGQYQYAFGCQSAQVLEVLKYPKQPDPATPVILYHGVLSVLIGTIVLLKQGQ